MSDDEIFKAKINVSRLVALEKAIFRVGDNASLALRRAANKVGAKARTATIRAIVSQTGLRTTTVRKALKSKGASEMDPQYRITSRGGDVGLKHFAAIEKGSGATAKVFGKAQFFERAFNRSGPKGQRTFSPKLRKGVFRNIDPKGKWGGKLQRVESGVIIPSEMIQGQSIAAFNRVVESDLPARLEYEIDRIMQEAK